MSKVRSLYFFIVTGVLVISQQQVRADSGADVLLNAVSVPGQKQNEKKISKDISSSDQMDIKLEDPFQSQLYFSWQSQKDFPYELNMWVRRIFKKDYVAAAHLISVVEPLIPSSFENTYQATQLYLFWKLNLPQTFVNRWINLSHNKSFRESPSAVSLDRAMAQFDESWLSEHPPVLSEEEVSYLKNNVIASSSFYQKLVSWAYLRSGENALPFLKNLNNKNRLIVPMAQTVSLAFARKNELALSGKVLKQYLEPAIESRGVPNELASYYMQLARLLYLAGALDEAEIFYEKIPNKTPYYLKAQEELTWVLLRKGDMSKLRGKLATLVSPLYVEQMSPEVFLVRAISNLKLCYFTEVKKDFDGFVELSKKWAIETDKVLSLSGSMEPREKDFFIELVQNKIQDKNEEIERLNQLKEASIQAALPAVGEQIHWKKAIEAVNTALEFSKKKQIQEWNRYWKNRKAVLAEAIRKMQFVKVEYLSQVKKFSEKRLSGSSDSQDQRIVDAQRSNLKKLEAESDKISFPTDGVYWKDEMFKLRSIAGAECLRGSTKR